MHLTDLTEQFPFFAQRSPLAWPVVVTQAPATIRRLLICTVKTALITGTKYRVCSITEVIDGVIQGLLDEGKLGESFGNSHPID